MHSKTPASPLLLWYPCHIIMHKTRTHKCWGTLDSVLVLMRMVVVMRWVGVQLRGLATLLVALHHRVGRVRQGRPACYVLAQLIVRQQRAVQLHIDTHTHTHTHTSCM